MVATTVEGGRPLMRFRVLGFPVHIDLSFLIIIGLLGYYPGVGPRDIALWLLIAPLAVLVHELGHAVLARRAGAAPSIALAGFGGVTTFLPPRPLSRATSIGISVAGPGVGIAVGLALVALGQVLDPDPGSWEWSALRVAQFTTLGWSLLNLLPILPLDGGQAVRELLPGNPDVRTRRAAMVSVVVGSVVAVAAGLAGYVFGAVFAAFLVLVNVLELRRPPGGPSPVVTEEASGPASGAQRPEARIALLLWEGRGAQARELLQAQPEGAVRDLALHGAVQAVTGQREQGLALLLQEWGRRPRDPDVLALLTLTHVSLAEWDAVVRLLDGPSGSVIPPSVAARAVQEASAAGSAQAADLLEAAALRARERGGREQEA